MSAQDLWRRNMISFFGLSCTAFSTSLFEDGNSITLLELSLPLVTTLGLFAESLDTSFTNRVIVQEC